MPTLIKADRTTGRMELVEDPFTNVAPDQGVPPGDVIIPLALFLNDGDRLLAEGRKVGVRLTSEEAVESLAYDLPRIAVVALEFPKFRDGRAFTSARLLRERYGFTGEIRAVGDVFREQAAFMLRCGFDAYEPSDGATADAWERAANRFRHVYQRAADRRAPAFAEREQ